VARFGGFDLDLQSGELSKKGTKNHLQGQPLQLLELFLQKPGQLVTREQIRQHLWPDGTVVEFEHSVNAAVKRLREALGDAYLLTCGAPILPSLGLCDGMRVGPDVAPYWISHRDSQLLMNFAAPGVQNALRTCLYRLWLKPLVNTDPDVVFFRTTQNKLTPGQKALLQDLAQITGFKATSDLPSWLTEQERRELNEFLRAHPAIEQVRSTSYRIDGRAVNFEPFLRFPQRSPLDRLLAPVVGALADIPIVLRTVDRIERKSLRRVLVQTP
jgi:hypothetical protein